MMDCYSAKRLLHLMADSTLRPTEEAALRSHLESCPTCTQELHELEHTFDRLRNLSPLRAKPGFAGQVALRLSQQQRETRRGWSRLAGNLGLAAAGALGLSLILMTLVDALEYLPDSDWGGALSQALDDWTPVVALEGMLTDPLALLEALHHSSAAAGATMGGLFLLGATLILVAGFATLLELLSASHHHNGFHGQPLQR